MVELIYWVTLSIKTMMKRYLAVTVVLLSLCAGCTGVSKYTFVGYPYKDGMIRYDQCMQVSNPYSFEDKYKCRMEQAKIIGMLGGRSR